VLRVSLLVIAISMLFGASRGANGAKRYKGNLLYWATVHSRIALWREIQNDFYAGRK
jgi:hypothetical protein